MTARTGVVLVAGVLGVGCATHRAPGAVRITTKTVAPRTCAVAPGDIATVRQLVEMLGDDNLPMVQFAFDNLFLCEQAIRPELVRLLDDRTPIQVGPVLVLNRMPHFELFAQYGPQQVVDALAIILSDPGDERVCSNLLNGGTTEDRDSCVAAWQSASWQGPITTR